MASTGDLFTNRTLQWTIPLSLIKMKKEIQNSKDCENLSIDDLAELRAGIADNSQKAVLIDNEIDRKKRIHQHELDLKLLNKQAKLMKTSNIIIAISTIAGAIVGALLTFWLR